MGDEHLITKTDRDFDADRRKAYWFSFKMVEKLFKNRRKSHWSTVGCDYLLDRLIEELEELKEARGGSADEIISECADVGNFAMMIADNVCNREGWK